MPWPYLSEEEEIREKTILYKFAYLPSGLFNRAQVDNHTIITNLVLKIKNFIMNFDFVTSSKMTFIVIVFLKKNKYP